MDWDELKKAAKAKLPKFVYDYIDGGAGDESGIMNNVSSLRKSKLRTRVLALEKPVKTQTSFFGKKADIPLVIAPTGLNELLRPDANALLATVALKQEIPFCLSSATSQDVTALCEAVAPPWYQLYISDMTVLPNRLAQIAEDGCRILMVTVDVPVGGWRPRDKANDFGPKLSARMFTQLILRPSWLYNQWIRKPIGALQPIDEKLLRRTMHLLTWDDLRKIRELWPHALVIKGILSVEDASRAAQLGADGIVISNHGGRQLNSAVSAFEILPEIAATLSKRLTIFVDGGFQTGEDVVKALIHGADGALIGRLPLFALAAGGERRLEKALRDLRSQIEISMTLLGASDVDRLKAGGIDFWGAS
jgi:(S)-mandelate dehydrogenase